MSLVERIKRAWNGDPIPPEAQADWDAMMKRQGFREPASTSAHLLRLEMRVAKLEGESHE